MDAEILRELVQIKWWMAALVIGLLTLTVIRTWIDVRRSGGPSEVLRRSFANRAKSLLEAGRAAELLKLAENRVEAAPGDAFAFWYLAQAAYRLGDTAAALKSIQKVGELQPDWREAHVDPFIRALGAGTGEPQWSIPSMGHHGPSKPH